ncbi:MAG: DNA helicase [Nitrospira sp. ST-bin5]|nr:MAG: DNA helicase [Nitrospira sp. ST-bin5]
MSNGTSDSGESTQPSAVVQIMADPTVSYASYQNNVPLLRGLSITNVTDEVLRDVEVSVRCEPEFADAVRLQFERLDPRETRRIDALDMKFRHQYLAELNEAERGRVVVRVSSAGVEIACTDHRVDVLAYDQWPGTRALPELLAAFSLPNNPAVDRLIFQAGELLTTVGNGRSMNGYQSKNREDVWAQISALYSAIGASGLHYCEPPASFTNDGQKIRTPDRVFSGGIATCMDLAMLFASCLEQAGLNPVVLIKKGHAWVGSWLINTTFPTPTFDDGQAVRKRVVSGELIVFETTALTHRPRPSLRVACESGLEHLQREDEFLFAIDVKRARIEQVRPLPSRTEAATAAGDQLSGRVANPGVEPPPALPPLDGEAFLLDENVRPETPEGRLARWKSKLLDLTLRNRLINFKPTKIMLPLRVPDPAHLEDALADGQEWKFRPLPQIMQGADPRVAAVAANRTGQDPVEAAAIQAMQQKELLATVEPKSLDSRLYEIYSAARLGLEEGGANTLYLALGFLRWAEDERAEKTHSAPILLVPVTLTRQSVRTGYAVKRHDDETIVNPTLVQLLRENFRLSLKGLDPLPTDGNGVDVKKIWQIFRLAVKEIPRWEVTEDVYLGIFSFTKYLMWKDLQDRTQQLKQNRVVDHLIERPREPIGVREDLSLREDLDERHAPGDLLAPLLADSSQLNALSRAGAGHDFALEGPPGTGKSQTITNLIAHFLGHGKTVLFVSEKMAALDVVERRLKNIGLGPFCLELHSAKARKTEVLAQLRAAMEAAQGQTAVGWRRESERVGRLRADLNDFVRALHKRHGNGLTVRGATDTVIRYREWTPARMPWLDPDTHDEEALDRLRETIRTIQSVVGELGELKSHPLALVQHTDWTNAWEERLLKEASILETAASRLQEAAVAIAPALGVKLDAPSAALLDAVVGLIDVLLLAPQVPKGFAAHGGNAAVRARMQIIRGHGENRQAHWRRLAKKFNPDISSVNGEQLTKDWSAASATWWPRRWFEQRAVAGRLVQYAVDQKKPSAEEIPSLLDALRGLNMEDREMKSFESHCLEILESEYKGPDTDWAAVQRYEQWGKCFEEAIGRFASGADESARASMTEQLRKLVSEQRSLLLPTGAVSGGLTAFRDAWYGLRSQLAVVTELSGAGQALAGEPAVAGLPSRVKAIVGGWTSARRSLRLWCRWRQLRREALAAELETVIRALEEGRISALDLNAYAEYSYQNWWLKAVTDREPALRNFASVDHDRKILEFRQADEHFQKLTEQYIVAVLAEKVPRQQAGQRPDSEMALVLREFAKQRAHLPVRQLVHRITNLLPRLKPCLLMSPLSVAQYLDPAYSNFDVVVFDEASQIPVWDAVGAIARGKQLIVVGDPKQLPPTNFFNRADDAEDTVLGNEEDAPVQDLESILDECLGAGLPTIRLEWHYRSRHESLITFSNHRYYDSRLITFPSPVTNDLAVTLKPVGGIYDRGATRTNRAEADAIVTEIVAHFSDESRCKLTMGVVTFNQTQQRLIETLLDEELRKHPEIEQRIGSHGSERLFIKNLENVQGDERDLILFSITYGKDAAGRMAMNFGPINQEGGQRRLNVAITRARTGVTIFSSILPEDIDLSKTRSAGVADLKNYLEFAVRGARAIVEQALPSGLEPESPLEIEILRALRGKGWIVHPQVGCSGYRIDMAVVHPHEQGRYLLGIECDGATYHSIPTARDRDRLRQFVLEGLGWTMHRVWSTDWWSDPGRETEKLETAINKQLAAHSSHREAGSKAL